MLLMERVRLTLASRAISTDNEVTRTKLARYEEKLDGAGVSGAKGRESRCP
jgi:hypothetical protein